MKIILIVLDSFGIGGADDAALYGDEGSNTYKAICDGIKIPNLVAMGLNNIDGNDYVPSFAEPTAAYGRMSELSCGKDTTSGHLEMTGIITAKPYPTYPEGFDEDIIKALEDAWGVEILGNVAASGTEIIARLGAEHMATRKPIVYTSADSVLQIACHEKIYSPNKLYDMCRVARKIMVGKNNVARIIARPFLSGADGNFYRSDGRKDFGIIPDDNLFTDLRRNGIGVVAIGKINDIFSGKDIDISLEAHGNSQVYEASCEAIRLYDDCLIFANFVDFDMLYGHRNDIVGYRACLEKFDAELPALLRNMKKDDVVIITADHGCDPSTPSTDHSRENVPLLVYGGGVTPRNLGTLSGFDNVSRIVKNRFKSSKSLTARTISIN